MKRYLLLLVMCASCAISFGEETTQDEITEKEMKRLERSVKLGSINDNTIRGDDREKLEQIKFYTNQDEDDAERYTFRVRIIVELTSNKTDSYYTSMAKLQGPVDTEYTGEDNWMFTLPHDTLEKVKLTAYIVQYGIQQGEKFIVLAEETDDVDTEEELKERSPTKLTQKAVLQHNHSFTDANGEVQQSGWE